MQPRSRNHAVALTSLFLGLFVAAPAGAASLQQVSSWGASGVPSYMQLYIYVPDTLATKPPILVSAHSCGSTATGQMGNIPKIKAAADANGFILILPDNPGRNCWDVGADSSLKHDGGGDTQAIAQMVKYALNKYNGDASRVYVMGGSSGAMLTQALMAVYPDVFRAGSARAGVAAGCWKESYNSGMQWSDPCAGGTVNKTAQAWGDQARAMFPGYTGHRPRIQLVHGDADDLIKYPNMAESTEQWTNVLGLSATPTSTDTMKAAVATYDRKFWKNACGYVVFETWAGKGGGHSMGYEEDAILKFFGLDIAGGTDPEPECPAGGTGGTGGSGGAGGAGGGSTGSSGSGGSSASIAGSSSTGGTGTATGTGGSGGTSGSGVIGVSGASTGIAGSVGVAGAAVAGAASTSAGASNGPSGTAGGSDTDSGGCALVSGQSKSKSAYGAAALGLALLAFGRRRRSAQR